MGEESNKIASNTAAQIIGRIFVLALTLISIKLITNYLGPTGTGYYTAIITYLSFFIVIADFGLFSVAVREISKRQSERESILRNVFLVRLISALAATLVAIGVIFLSNYSPEVKYGVLAAALFPVFNLIGSVYDMIFQSKLMMQKVAIAEVASKAVAVTAIYLVILTQTGFYGIVATISLAALTSFLIKAWLSRRDLPFGLKYDHESSINIIKMALPLGIVFIVNNIYFKIDTLMLFYFKGAADVGIYSVAYRVLETTLFAGSYLSSSLKPLLATSVENDKPKAEKAVTQANIFLLFMALIIAIICIVFPREIILFLSNSDFLAGAPALVILGFAAVFIYVGGLFGEVMIAKDMRRTMIKVSGFILLFNIGLNLLLIPRYSYLGAAIATLASEIILLVIGYTVARRALDINLDTGRISRLLAVSVVSILVAQYLKHLGLYFIVNITLTASFYVGLAYIFDAIPKNLVRGYLKSLSLKWQ
ncbi:MAG: flippase [Patescibacteria group bacterium]